MSLAPIALCVIVILLVAYRTYGGWLSRKLELDPDRRTPSVELRDDIDFIPTEPRFLLGQHFSAIAAAGPIVGPILAGIMFGWGPALIWILIGAILIGGVHDMTSLAASIRHQAKSIAEVVRVHMSPRSYLLFLLFIWFSLVYIIVAFTDITAQSFVGAQTLENGEIVSGGAIASASLMYLILPILMGILMRYARAPLWLMTIIFVPSIIGVIWLGKFIPISLETIMGVSEQDAHKIWDAAILFYCVFAAVAPMWILLQPRGHLGGFFLYFFLISAVLGILFGGKTAQYPFFTSWISAKGDSLAPFLFITIACGAVSGFHSLIASGTTSKQLRRETDAKLVGYGCMLLEAGVAFMSLACVMMLSKDDPLTSQSPNLIFAHGIGGFLELAGIPAPLAISIMLMAFTTFVYDTLDVCTRLGRYIIQELTGLQNSTGMWLGTLITALTPLFFVTQTVTDTTGNPIPAWKLFWPLFGASNQLLAALALLVITVWIWRTTGKRWIFAVAGIPCVFMYITSCWALVTILSRGISLGTSIPILVIGGFLLLLALWMIVEAMMAFWSPRLPREYQIS